ncbi:F-box only protein 46 [Electrophorus electricus]|uniref:F-box domain-containing protein n=2 Tax=Electrophorus TaxID=8004 RepID=A0A4W4GLG6_ELEEL|nr:F-box only protein 46 [Electrophorus electricus]XP_026860478.2 F-box only protein 46 [Electrophorus electricus]
MVKFKVTALHSGRYAPSGLKMNRDTFSHIRLWCPRPFGTYSQNKPYSNGTTGSGTSSLCKADTVGCTSIEAGGVGEERDEDVGTENTPPAQATSLLPPPPPAPPSPTSQMEDGRVLLDTWYVIKPGNTKEKIAFFVAHQCSGAGFPRPSAMKVKGNWGGDCTKAKRRRRCSSYDPPVRAQHAGSELHSEPCAPDDAVGVSDTDLLSVAEMVALVEQRAAMALQGMVAHGQTASGNQHHTVLQNSDSSPVVFLSENRPIQQASKSDFEQQQESRRVARAVAHFESQQQNLDSALLRPQVHNSAKERDCVGETGAASQSHSRGEVRIAFRVSSLDTRSQSEPEGRPRCMFMSCGSGGGQAGARAKEKITCDLYQLVSPSSRDPGAILAGSPKSDILGEGVAERPAPTAPDPNHDHCSGEKKTVARERMTGFHVEVVVTGAVDQCVFYGKDSTENVQEETVCFAMPGGANTAGSSEDPPPGQLFFLQTPSAEDESSAGVPSGLCSLDCANNNGPVGAAVERPESPIASVDDCADKSLCRLYRHVSHDFLEIRFQIQRLLEPRQYMLMLPDHIMVSIFSYLPTRSLAALKCTCHDFKTLIETYGVRATDSRWNQDPLYRDDPCKQCKRQYERGDVSLCRWHPKPYHHDLPYGRSYWMCCRRTDKDTPGCRVGLHDNNWVQPCDMVQVRTRREDGR